MPKQREPSGFGGGGQTFTELSFDDFGHLDVDHLATRDAHEVMVVPLQIFGEFESRTLTIGEDLHDHTGFLEHGQVSVHAALREILGGRRDLGGHQRMLGS